MVLLSYKSQKSTKAEEDLPEKFKIATKEQLFAILDERKDEDKGKCFTVDEAWANLDRHREAINMCSRVDH